MSVTIELPPDIEQQLKQVAARQGQEPAAFARAAVEEKLRDVATPPLETNGSSPGPISEPPMLDQMLAGLTGVIHSRDGCGTSRLSESTGEDMARDLVEKQRQGRL